MQTKITQDSEKYNGWTNYATWRVNLEIVDGMDDEWNEKEGRYFGSIRDLADHIKDSAIEAVEGYGDVKAGFAHDYAMAFLADVNWYEIATNVSVNYPHLLVAKQN